MREYPYPEDEGERGPVADYDDSDYDEPLPAVEVLDVEARKTVRLLYRGRGGRGAATRLAAARVMLELIDALKAKAPSDSSDVRPIRSPEELARIAEILRLDRKRERQG